jgi:hypothetical protein
MADRQTSAPANGDSRPRQDTTTQPGQYPSKLPFGVSVPQSTGAPGSAGKGSSAPDPTMAGGPTPTGNFGANFDDLHTGSPGSTGVSPNQQSGASYTDPFAVLCGNGMGEMHGGSTETQAAGNKAGHPGPFGVANPLNTGSGEGTPLIGGKGGKNRGR